MNSYVIYIADLEWYVVTMSAFSSARADALRFPTVELADAWVDWMSDRFFAGATWRVLHER